MRERMATGVACGLQNRHGAYARPGWVRFPHVPATLSVAFLVITLAAVSPVASGPGAPAGLLAQTPEQRPPGAPPLEPAPPPASTDSTPPVSPVGALARSLVLPGWGQTAVGRPARGAIYFAAEAGSLFMVFKSHAKLSAARRADPPKEDLVDARTSQRENWIVLAAFIAFVSGLDAWVSAHFWDFESSVTAPEEGTVQVSVHVPLGFP